MHERKVKITGGLYNSYTKYKKENSHKKIDRNTYCKICHQFNKIVSNKIITESFEFKIPFGLGYLRVKATKPNLKIKDGKLLTYKMAIDWNSTWNLWNKLYPNKTREEIKKIPDKKLIVHTNEHTDGRVMRWYWDKRISTFRNQTVYLFRPVKGGVSEELYSGRLGLASWINNPNRNNEYYY